MPSQVLTGVVTTQASDNTPGRCASRCKAQGYAYAGVEYGNECHSGTGIKSGTAMGDCDVVSLAEDCGGYIHTLIRDVQFLQLFSNDRTSFHSHIPMPSIRCSVCVLISLFL